MGTGPKASWLRSEPDRVDDVFLVELGSEPGAVMERLSPTDQCILAAGWSKPERSQRRWSQPAPPQELPELLLNHWML
jgi:hypothetical protein